VTTIYCLGKPIFEHLIIVFKFLLISWIGGLRCGFFLPLLIFLVFLDFPLVIVELGVQVTELHGHHEVQDEEGAEYNY
jgi:hypothetical protein